MCGELVPGVVDKAGDVFLTSLHVLHIALQEVVAACFVLLKDFSQLGGVSSFLVDVEGHLARNVCFVRYFLDRGAHVKEAYPGCYL